MSSLGQRKRRKVTNDDDYEADLPLGNYYGATSIDGQARVLQGNSYDTHYHIHDQPRGSDGDRPKEATVKELMQSLKFQNMDSRLHNIRPALAKTCRWLFSHKTFVRWSNDALHDEHKGFLWIKGNPGTGKSTLMKAALQWAKRNKRKQNYITLSYFFNARAPADLEKSPLGLYRSLVHQLLQANSSLLPVLFDMFSWKCESDVIEWTEVELQGFLMEAIKDEDRTPLCIFIDALDEGNDKEIRELISFLEDLISHATEDPSLKVCLSSRHYPHITVRQGLSLIVEVQREHGRDIEMYVSEKLRSLEHDQLRRDICRKSAGIFLWVVLVVPIVYQMHDQGRSLAEMTTYLQTLPGDLEGVFAEILRRNADGYQECVALLQWVLYSTRPLSTTELYLAVQHSWVHSNQEGLSVPGEAALHRYLVHNSHGLVELTRSEPPVAQFIHESVREFLISKNGLCRLDYALNLNLCGWSHARLAQACLCYFSWNICHLPKAFDPILSLFYPDSNEISEKFPFMEYAVCNVLAHADTAEREGIPQLNLLNLLKREGEKVNRQWKDLRNQFEKHCIRRYPENVTLLYVVVDMKLSHLAKELAKDPVIVNKRCGGYGNVLTCACRGGREDIVRDLIERGAVLNETKSGEYKSPLEAAAAAKSLKTLHLLLEYPNWSRRSLQTACMLLALSSCKQGIDVLLLKYKPSTILSHTVLHASIRKNQPDMVEYLIEKGANINEIDINGATALYRAAETPSVAGVIRLLLKHGAVCNDMNRYPCTALHRATIMGYVENVCELLKGNSDIDKKTVGGDSSLHLAVDCRDYPMVEVLLQNGVDSTLTNIRGDSPLHQICRQPYVGASVGIIDLLLRYGADIGKVNADGHTPLSLAVQGNMYSAVNLFLQKGADANTTDNNGDSLLHLACKHSKEPEKVIGQLLRCGASINNVNAAGQTPLQIAISMNNKSVVSFLTLNRASTAILPKQICHA